MTDGKKLKRCLKKTVNGRRGDTMTKHIEDPAALKVRTQANQRIMRALKAQGYKIRFEYLLWDNGNAEVTHCFINKDSKDRWSTISISGSTAWNEEKDVQNRKYARAVAFERAYRTYQKYIKLEAIDA